MSIQNNIISQGYRTNCIVEVIDRHIYQNVLTKWFKIVFCISITCSLFCYKNKRKNNFYFIIISCLNSVLNQLTSRNRLHRVT